MIGHAWSILCSSSSIDSDSNNISLFNVLERINIEGPKDDERGILPIEMEFISLWMQGDKPGRGFARVLIQGPSGEIPPTNELLVDLSGDTIARFRTRHKFLGLPFVGFGTYWFHAELKLDGEEKWQTFARVPLEIGHFGK